ncbi:MAG: MazG-like family protein [Candidatus Moraniibacteriota bacterium]|jgi:NTP pyrophosphatase (non-canonical NTP hydrolase)
MTINLKKLQAEAFENKVEKGFNIDDVSMEFCLMNSEVNEAWLAWYKKDDNVGEELADVAIYLLGLSEMLGIDLEKELIVKMKKNEDREYENIKGRMIRKKDSL